MKIGRSTKQIRRENRSRFFRGAVTWIRGRRGPLYNGMISPLTRYPIRGVIWYQGETNSRLELTPTMYKRVFPAMIGDWRSAWGEGDFPFLYVQLANFTSTDLEDWATIREAQRKTLRVRNTAMVVSIDIGDPADVHP